MVHRDERVDVDDLDAMVNVVRKAHKVLKEKWDSLVQWVYQEKRGIVAFLAKEVKRVNKV